MKKYAFYDKYNIVKQTFVAELDAESLSSFMVDYESLFNTVGVQEYNPDDEIEVGWSVATHSIPEATE